MPTSYKKKDPNLKFEQGCKASKTVNSISEQKEKWVIIHVLNRLGQKTTNTFDLKGNGRKKRIGRESALGVWINFFKKEEEGKKIRFGIKGSISFAPKSEP